MTSKNQSDTEKHLKQVYGYYKKLDLWSLTEGIAILTFPFSIHPADPDTPNIFEHGPLSERCLDIKVFKRAIESGKLKTDGYDKTKTDNWKPVDNGHLNYDVQSDYWYSCFDKVTVSPFDFLEFVKEKDLFEIPSELEWVRIDDKDLWASEATRHAKPGELPPLKIESTGHANNDVVGEQKSEVDYSKKTDSEKTFLAKRWKEDGVYRREIARRLYKQEIEHGFLKENAAMKRVDRLLNPNLS